MSSHKRKEPSKKLVEVNKGRKCVVIGISHVISDLSRDLNSSGKTINLTLEDGFILEVLNRWEEIAVVESDLCRKRANLFCSRSPKELLRKRRDCQGPSVG